MSDKPLHKKNCKQDDWLKQESKFDIIVTPEDYKPVRLFLVITKRGNYKRHGDLSIIVNVDTKEMLLNRLNYDEMQQ
jgi:hypothetical protein